MICSRARMPAWFVLPCALWLLGLTQRTEAQTVLPTATTCATEGYRVVTPQLLAIQCAGDASQLPMTSGAITASKAGSLPIGAGPTLGLSADTHWLLVPLQAPLQPNVTYSLTLTNSSLLVDVASGKAQPTFSFNT